MCDVVYSFYFMGSEANNIVLKRSCNQVQHNPVLKGKETQAFTILSATSEAETISSIFSHLFISTLFLSDVLRT